MFEVRDLEACFRKKMSEGSEVFLLRSEGKALGVMSLTGSTVADLYLLPEERRKGYGSKLLEYAIGRCRETPRLWILETNTGAERLYPVIFYQHVLHAGP